MMNESIVFLDKSINGVVIHIGIDVGDTYCRMSMVDLNDAHTVILNITESEIDVLIESLESSKDLIQARNQFVSGGGR